MKNKLSLKSRITANKTPLEVYKYLKKKNPLLTKLIQKFDLKL